MNAGLHIYIDSSMDSEVKVEAVLESGNCKTAIIAVNKLLDYSTFCIHFVQFPHEVVEVNAFSQCKWCR